MKRRKALAHLAARIKQYEEWVRNSTDGGKGLTKPGSMSGKK